ncbi:hypothetical protein Q3G72_001017 [Acer saccharum]|nr:hypothetical protein Q3G72_001017 [Acer saccharum]
MAFRAIGDMRPCEPHRTIFGPYNSFPSKKRRELFVTPLFPLPFATTLTYTVLVSHFATAEASHPSCHCSRLGLISRLLDLIGGRTRSTSTATGHCPLLPSRVTAVGPCSAH